MTRRFLMLSSVALAALCIAPQSAFADSAQLLPPTESTPTPPSSGTQPSCVPGGLNRVLSWNGTSAPIFCDQQFVYDPASMNVGLGPFFATGTLTKPDAKLHVTTTDVDAQSGNMNLTNAQMAAENKGMGSAALNLRVNNPAALAGVQFSAGNYAGGSSNRAVLFYNFNQGSLGFGRANIKNNIVPRFTVRGDGTVLVNALNPDTVPGDLSSFPTLWDAKSNPDHSRYRALHVLFKNDASDGANGQIVVENLGTSAAASSAINIRVSSPSATSGLHFSLGDYGKAGTVDPNDPTRSGKGDRAAFVYNHGAGQSQFYTRSTAGTEGSNMSALSAKLWIERSGKTVIKPDPAAIGGAAGLALLVNGSIQASNVSFTSDERLKDNVKALQGSGVEMVAKLRPVTFTWKKDPEGNKPEQVGFIAQEVEKVLPQLVNASNEGEKIKSVNYVGLIPVLTKAIQEQALQIEALKKELEALKAK